MLGHRRSRATVAAPGSGRNVAIPGGGFRALAKIIPPGIEPPGTDRE